MENKHMEKCSMSLATRNMQIITTIKYQYKPTIMAKIENSDNTKC